MRLTFFGAAGEVTGSKHLVEFGEQRILLDCGMYQGPAREQGDRNRLPFPGSSITAILISHAHLDHVGLLPVLVKSGFTGPIISTAATRDLAELILLDAAKLQQQDAEYANRKRWPGSELVVPLYTAEDIPAVMQRWQVWPYANGSGIWHDVCPGIKAKLYDAGHILGSAVIVVTDGREAVAFTGDLGRQDTPLLNDPVVVHDPVATLIMESTYGGREHQPVHSVMGKLTELVQRVVARRGKIVVPAFSLGRTQELVYLLHELTDQGRIPRLPIYVDSPLASQITTVFTQHQQEYDAETKSDFRLPGEDPLIFRNLQYTHSVEDSKALNSMSGPLMIISASGMATGGRIMHHLANTLDDPKNMVLFTGYQAQGTVGRHIVERQPTVRLFGRSHPVRAEVATLNDLSAHADVNELSAYAAAITGVRNVYLVHGEPNRASVLQQRLQTDHPDWQVTIPTRGQTYDV
ncbi:MAG: MBL fold metallo-hydrolase [Candidatus Kerfeldbacteria bacterium]|nr:MBL fold metallo-hydrolase [Candidatus Kerfeldbacteria bacterium]